MRCHRCHVSNGLASGLAATKARVVGGNVGVMGIRTAIAALMLAGLVAGCRGGPVSEQHDVLDTPASSREPLTPATVDQADGAVVTSPFSADDRERLTEIARALDGVPSDSHVVRFEPAFDANGALGAVVVLRHAAYSGSVELPGLDFLIADGREIVVPQVVRYTVDSAAGTHVAVDLGAGEVLWATPSLGSVVATELVSRRDTDIEGAPVPPDARQLEGE